MSQEFGNSQAEWVSLMFFHEVTVKTSASAAAIWRLNWGYELLVQCSPHLPFCRDDWMISRYGSGLLPKETEKVGFNIFIMT